MSGCDGAPFPLGPSASAGREFGSEQVLGDTQAATRIRARACIGAFATSSSFCHPTRDHERPLPPARFGMHFLRDGFAQKRLR
jgi:hypothetical protein